MLLPMKFLNRLFRRNKLELHDKSCNVQYLAVINDKWQWFSTKEDMFNYISEYSNVNTIFKLAMFRNEMYELEKNEQ